jgi:hypothetical protein
MHWGVGFWLCMPSMFRSRVILSFTPVWSSDDDDDDGGFCSHLLFWHRFSGAVCAHLETIAKQDKDYLIYFSDYYIIIYSIIKLISYSQSHQIILILQNAVAVHVLRQWHFMASWQLLQQGYQLEAPPRLSPVPRHVEMPRCISRCTSLAHFTWLYILTEASTFTTCCIHGLELFVMGLSQ